MNDADQNAALVKSLGAQLQATLDQAIPAGSRVALIDHPNSNNVGDNMIWLGELAYLHSRGASVVYACSEYDYNPRVIARRLGDGIILLHGGGNFGDLYPNHNALRRRVLKDFPSTRIVQLPQSINFRAGSELTTMQRAVADHSNLQLLVRDEQSLETSLEAFDASVALCPDMAFALGHLPRPRRAEVDLVWLARTDKERTDEVTPGTFQSIDWTADATSPLSQRLARRVTVRVGPLVGASSLLSSALSPVLATYYERVSRNRLSWGAHTLAAGRLVVADRLHAHILCILLGIPHIIYSDRYGKVRNFYSTWTHVSPLVALTHNAQEAIDVAQVRLKTERESAGPSEH